LDFFGLRAESQASIIKIERGIFSPKLFTFIQKLETNFSRAKENLRKKKHFISRYRDHSELREREEGEKIAPFRSATGEGSYKIENKEFTTSL